jgi:hypothetical protein
MGYVFIRVNSKETMENQMTKENKMTKPNLTTEQFNVIEESFHVMRNILNSTYDIQDIYLSDLKKLDETFHQLKVQFDLKEIDW